MTWPGEAAVAARGAKKVFAFSFSFFSFLFLFFIFCLQVLEKNERTT